MKNIKNKILIVLSLIVFICIAVFFIWYNYLPLEVSDTPIEEAYGVKSYNITFKFPDYEDYKKYEECKDYKDYISCKIPKSHLEELFEICKFEMAPNIKNSPRFSYLLKTHKKDVTLSANDLGMIFLYANMPNDDESLEDLKSFSDKNLTIVGHYTKENGLSLSVNTGAHQVKVTE